MYFFSLFAHQDIIKHIVTGRYWYDNKVSKWVWGGVQILGYLDEHPEQAQLLGFWESSDFSLRSWKNGEKRCSGLERNVLLEDPQDCAALVVREGDVTYLNSHVIFRQAADGQMCVGRIREILISSKDPNTVVHVGLQLFSFTDTLHSSIHLPCLNLTDDKVVTTAMDIICVINLQHNYVDSQCKDTVQQPMHQEQLETSHTKPIVQYKSTPHYFINAYSIHNYDYINLVIPEMLHESLLRVMNVAEVLEIAVQQMKQKKASKKSGDAPQLDDHIEHNTQIPLLAAPTFNQAPPKSKTAAKSKAKAATSRAQRKAATSKTGQVIAGSSSQLPSAQQGSIVHIIDHQNQAHFVPPPVFPPQYYHPPDHSQLPPPQLYDPPPPALYLHPGSSQRHHEAIERSYTGYNMYQNPSGPYLQQQQKQQQQQQ
ncbi:hypothetical protein F4604DRAFT_1681597 [Suillus subluteus]|nr:hypothetical protein F4604DRAFT_1681597 [Suillus subluteus]